MASRPTTPIPFDVVATAYLVGYPHSTIRLTEDIERLRCYSGTTRRILPQLVKDLYPEYVNDLKGATIRKASCSSVAQIPP